MAAEYLSWLLWVRNLAGAPLGGSGLGVPREAAVRGRMGPHHPKARPGLEET